MAALGLALVAAACGGKAAAPTTSSTLPPLPPDELAFVTEIGVGGNVGSGTSLYGLDLSTSGSLSHTFQTGTFPDAVAITPNGELALVANYESNDVTVINLHTGKVERSVDAGDGPAGIAVTPDGKTAYVTDAGTSPIGDKVTPINLKTMKPETAITVGAGPQGIAITPDGKTAYVADAGAVVSGQSGAYGTTVTPINLSTGTAESPITVGNAPISVAVSPDGSTVWVANSGSGSVTPISTGSNAAGTSVSVTGSPVALAVSPDGGTVWVADTSSSTSGNNLTPISTSTDTASTPVTVPKGPTSIAIDGTTAWVVASGAAELVPVDLSSSKVESSAVVQISGGPYAVALAPEQHSAALVTLGSSPKKKSTKNS